MKKALVPREFVGRFDGNTKGLDVPGPKSREVIPWKLLEGGSEDGLRRIVALCESSYVEESSGRTIATFGKSGPAVAKEILAYLDSASGKATKKNKSAKKKADPAHQAEVGLIEAFKGASMKALSAPAIIRYGTDRMHFRRAITSGWAPESIEALMDLFFANANDPFVFRKGDVKSFITSLPRLSVIRGTSDDKTVAISGDNF